MLIQGARVFIMHRHATSKREEGTKNGAENDAKNGTTNGTKNVANTGAKNGKHDGTKNGATGIDNGKC